MPWSILREKVQPLCVKWNEIKWNSTPWSSSSLTRNCLWTLRVRFGSFDMKWQKFLAFNFKRRWRSKKKLWWKKKKRKSRNLRPSVNEEIFSAYWNCQLVKGVKENPFLTHFHLFLPFSRIHSLMNFIGRIIKKYLKLRCWQP